MELKHCCAFIVQDIFLSTLVGFGFIVNNPETLHRSVLSLEHPIHTDSSVIGGKKATHLER